MKIRITMKDPDCLDDAIADQVKRELDKVEGVDPEEREQLVEARCERIREKLRKWFEYGEYLTVECDTEADTAIVIQKGK